MRAAAVSISPAPLDRPGQTGAAACQALARFQEAPETVPAARWTSRKKLPIDRVRVLPYWAARVGACRRLAKSIPGRRKREHGAADLLRIGSPCGLVGGSVSLFCCRLLPARQDERRRRPGRIGAGTSYRWSEPLGRHGQPAATLAEPHGGTASSPGESPGRPALSDSSCGRGAGVPPPFWHNLGR